MGNLYPTLYFNTPLIPYEPSSYLNWRRIALRKGITVPEYVPGNDDSTPIGEDQDSSRDVSEEKSVSYWFDRLQDRFPEDEPESQTVEQTDNQSSVPEKDDIQSISVMSSPPPEPLEEVLDEKGLEDYLRKQALRIAADRQMVEELVKRSNRCIISISTGNSLSLCPSTIKVEESRVPFIFRQLFTTQSHIVDIKDISNVFVESSLFSANLQIVSKTYVQNDTKICNLNKKKALRVRMIIEGLRTLAANNINTSRYTVEELISKIEAMHSD